MPVHALHTIKAGTTSKLLLLWARDESTGAARSGLSAGSSGAGAAYVREGEGARAVHLQPGSVGSWSEGGFIEVDPDRAPGVYQLGVPDDLLAEGATHVLLMVRFDGAWIEPIEIELVAFDPQDETSIGIAELQADKRHEFLRQTLPGLTAEDLDLGRRAERELKTRMATARRTPEATS